MCVPHTLSLTFSVAANFIQQFVRLMQKSNCLLKTWLTKTPVLHNNGEVILLILVISQKGKACPQFQIFYEYFTAILAD